MERQNTAPAMLALLPHPSFCAEKGIVVHVNDSARQLQITPGIQVMDILQTGKKEYTQFTEGCLYLTIMLSGCQFCAQVTKVNEFDVFTLEQENCRTHLQPLALAAMELRRPLAGIMTVVDTLLPSIEQAADERTAHQLAQLNRSLYQLQRMIGNMSDAGRLSANQSAYLETRDICSILRELAQNVENLAETHEIIFSYSLPEQRIYCPLDTQLLERAVLNLISNAFKFTPSGGHVDLKLTRQNNHLYLSVTNNGEVPLENLSKAFTRYLRSPAIEDSRNGIGLGMVMVRTAATAHRGTVLIEQPDSNSVRVTMSISMANTENVLRSNIQRVDYAGEHPHLLVELSDCLNAEFYKPYRPD